jgi:uncharacterized RDD family membrane protein YckC
VGDSPYAGLVSRLVALVLDGLVVAMLVLAVASMPEMTWASLSPHTVPHWLGSATSIVASVVAPLYFAALWGMTGQTLGDLATGITVEHRDGRRMSYPHALLRAVIGLLLAPVWLVGMLAILGDRNRRAWHDHLLRTDVRYATHHRH